MLHLQNSKHHDKLYRIQRRHPGYGEHVRDLHSRADSKICGYPITPTCQAGYLITGAETSTHKAELRRNQQFLPALEILHVCARLSQHCSNSTRRFTSRKNDLLAHCPLLRSLLQQLAIAFRRRFLLARFIENQQIEMIPPRSRLTYRIPNK